MIFFGKTRDQQLTWKKRFAFFPVQIGVDSAGTAVMLHFEWYEERWTGMVQYNPSLGNTNCMERRALGSTEAFAFMG